jgi:putative exporter of polyketide antibiotics
MLNILLADAVANTTGGSYFSSLTLLFVVGFIAAVTIGSIAWYNSKRPEGWEDKERPSIVPEIEKEETPGLGNPEA